MKKLYFSIAMMAAVSSFAQQISNGGFENWSGSPSRPTGWVTIATLTGGGAPTLAVKDTTLGNFVEGKASIKLSADTISSPQGSILVAGIANYGSGVFTGTDIVFYGVPFVNRPDTLRFSYKYQGVGKDSAIFNGFLTKWNATASQTVDVGGGSIKLGNTGNSWANVFAPIPYYTSDNPDTLSILISCSDGPNTTDGSVVRFDNMRFTYKTQTGIQDVALEYADITMYPNPTTDRITFKTAKDLSNMDVRIYALNGELVSEQKLSNNSANVSSLGAGTYIFELLDNTFSAVKGKFNVVR